jgi:A/G-specific adenine glycosylase
MPTPDDNKTEFQRLLLQWCGNEQRDFPWRNSSSPYHILVAEKLLQQTAARAQVIEAYEELLRRYPTAQTLMAAEVTDLEEIIRPLGLVYRALHLVMMARNLVELYDGSVPTSLKELKALHGIGDYAARAVLSFAFGEDVPVVDTNVIRILYRLYRLEDPVPVNPTRSRRLIELAGSLVPAGRSKEWNLAILDLGALICKSAKPLCPKCPVQEFCEYGFGREEPPLGKFPKYWGG